MKPRIFVSSTFYDLKHIREELSRFIKSYYFDPVLFEDGDIGYTSSLHLDESCYQTIDTCDMVILIIGGNYGTIATSQETDDEYFPKLISITRREYRKAVEYNIPIFVFVDKAVYAEYNIYQLNKEEIEKNHVSIIFSATKDINVFKFIDEIKSMGIYSITEFDQFATIQNFLQKQWADFFKTYLHNLRKDKEHQIIKSGIEEINGLIRKLNDLSDNILQKVAPDDYKEIEQKMNDSAVLNHLKILCSRIATAICTTRFDAAASLNLS